LGNLITVIAVITTVTIFNSHSSYFRAGPSDDFVVISVAINTWSKYGVLLFLISIINIVQVFSEEIGSPIIEFNIYNPDKTHITEFTKCELHMMGNIMFGLSAIRRVFMVMVSITQIDIAIWSVVVKEITSIFTIRKLLDDKTFGPYEPVTTDDIIELV